MRAGASLIQLYSSLVYKGLGLVNDIENDLASTLLRAGARRTRCCGDRQRGCHNDHRQGSTIEVVVGEEPSHPDERTDVQDATPTPAQDVATS